MMTPSIAPPTKMTNGDRLSDDTDAIPAPVCPETGILTNVFTDVAIPAPVCRKLVF